VSFPIQYNESFYHGVVQESNKELNKYAYHNDTVVAALCSRIETIPDSELFLDSAAQGLKRLYIMTLAVLAPYRGCNIGSQLLQTTLEYCLTNPDISQIALHVQISNQDAIRFYCNRFGFEQGDMVENYYKRIDPPHCYLLYKDVRALQEESKPRHD
jgi:N-alpha-acetyltransferase 50